LSDKHGPSYCLECFNYFWGSACEHPTDEVWAERNRIINLINACPKDEQWHLDNLMCCEGRCDFAIQDYQNRLIALIKGENK
jgi:hypothetical protein